MKIAIASARLIEVQGLITFLQNQSRQLNPFHFKLRNLEIQILITGSGNIRTVYALTRYFQHQSVDLLIHSGLALCLKNGVKKKQVFQVSEDILLKGTTDPYQNTKHQSEFFLNEDTNKYPFEDGKLKNSNSGRFLPVAKSISYSLEKINEASFKELKQRYPDADLISSENTAVFFTAIMEKINFLSIKSTITFNKEKKNQSERDAISKLNKTLIDIVLTLSE